MIRPHIDEPASGDVFSPGPITLRGKASPGAPLEIKDQVTGDVLVTINTADDGAWQITIQAQTEGQLVLVAAVAGTQDLTLISDPVMITLAPPVQPSTGANQDADPDETGRVFTALVALLLSAGGFSAYFAGRLIIMAAKDRFQSH
jgi:hypothetical protein